MNKRFKDDMLFSNMDIFGRISYYNGPEDIDGNPVKKTKQEYPYSYSEFVVWRGGKNNTWDDAAYSDRLLQWDYTKYKDCVEKVFPSGGAGLRLFSESRSTEEFLRLYYDDPELKLVLILEGCNASNGYPYWVVFFKYGKEKKKEFKRKN